MIPKKRIIQNLKGTTSEPLGTVGLKIVRFIDLETYKDGIWGSCESLPALGEVLEQPIVPGSRIQWQISPKGSRSPWTCSPDCKLEAPKDHGSKRILQSIVTGMPLGLGP